ncbi:glycosyltransferase [Microbacterium sp. PM5]|uniref:glycosyltransferase n=1 Tax=Microbacterium sp. PM5 TaxID=2014534 RepID=UPI001EF75DE9|nr:glycosyltransferase [Microbacterium sp. PM5]
MLKPSRVLVVGLNYPPETTGIAPYTGGAARGLLERGFDVRVVATHPHYPGWRLWEGYGGWTRDETLDGVRVNRLRHYVPRRPTPVARALSEATFGLRQALRPWGRIDAVVAVSPALISSAIVLLRAKLSHRHAPFVVWVQDLYGVGISETAQGGGAAARVVRAIEGLLLRSASTVVVIHERFGDRVHKDFGVPRERIAVIRNWTHLPSLPPVDVSAVRAARGWADDEVVVVHTGNMGVKQGLHHVVDAGRLAHDRGARVRFVLVGNGSQRDELQQRAEAQPTTTQFLPPLGDRDFTDILQAADILLVNELPGVAEMAVPSKLTSYFAAGRPVLAATDSTGITAQEVRAADAGLVVSAGDPSALLDGVSALMADRAAADLLGQNGKRYRETVLDETFAIDRFDSLLADLIATAAEKHPA